MNFDPPSRSPSRAGRLPLRIIATAAVVVALASLSLAMLKQSDGDLVIVAGLNVRKLSVIVCGVVCFGIGTLVLSVTNQVAIAREQTAGAGMAAIVFLVIMGWCGLSGALLLAGFAASNSSYIPLDDTSGNRRLMLATNTWEGSYLSLYSGEGVEFTRVPTEMDRPIDGFDPFTSAQYTISERNGGLELTYPLRPGGPRTSVLIP